MRCADRPIGSKHVFTYGAVICKIHPLPPLTGVHASGRAARDFGFAKARRAEKPRRGVSIPMIRSSSPPAGGGGARSSTINNMYYVYAIHNGDADKIYIGQTHDVAKRLEEHNNHTFKSFTSRFQGQWVLIYSESVATRSEALVREKQLKSFRGREFVKQQIKHN